MKSFCVGLLTCSILMLTGCLRKMDSTGDAEAVKKTVEEHIQGLNERNLNTAVKMMTGQTYYAPVHQPAVIGQESARKLLQKTSESFSQFDIRHSAQVLDVQTSGQLAAARGTWSLKGRDKAGALADINQSGSWALIARRENNGSWKWDSVIINTDQMLPGTTTTGADEKSLIEIEKNVPAAMMKAEKALGSLKPAYKLDSVTIKDLKPYVFDDFAVVRTAGKMQGIYNGNPASGTMKGIDFFVRREGRWEAAYSHTTATIP